MSPRDGHVGLPRRDAIRITAVAGLGTVFAGGVVRRAIEEARLHRVSETRSRMGTVVALTVVSPDAEAAKTAVRSAFLEMERLEGLLSRHRPDTPLARLNHVGRLDGAPPELLSVLATARTVSEASGGAFDVTIGPVLRVWSEAWARTGQAPPASVVADALTRVDYRAVEVDGDRIVLADPGMSVTLDGVAKGYVVDRTVARLVAAGADRVFVNAGGDIATAGPAQATDSWTVGLQHPREPEGLLGLLRLEEESVATSGDYLRNWSVDRRHHDILDPRTGYSPPVAAAASVTAPTAAEADALSTAALVLGPRDGIALLERLHGVDGLVIGKDGARALTTGMARRLG